MSLECSQNSISSSAKGKSEDLTRTISADHLPNLPIQSRPNLGAQKSDPTSPTPYGWLHEYNGRECLKSSLAFRKPAMAAGQGQGWWPQGVGLAMALHKPRRWASSVARRSGGYSTA